MCRGHRVPQGLKPQPCLPALLQARAPTGPKLMAFRRVATSLGAAAVVLSSAAAPVLASDLVLGAEVFNNNCGEPGYS